jgi:uncharacterized protein YraI
MMLNHSAKKFFSCLLAGMSTSLVLVSTATPNDAAGKSVCSFITGRAVNVRSGPGTNFKTVASLKRGDTVRASHRKANWVKLVGRVSGTAPNERVRSFDGWVSNQYINGCSEDKFDMWRR